MMIFRPIFDRQSVKHSKQSFTDLLIIDFQSNDTEKILKFNE